MNYLHCKAFRDIKTNVKQRCRTDVKKDGHFNFIYSKEFRFSTQKMIISKFFVILILMKAFAVKKKSSNLTKTLKKRTWAETCVSAYFVATFLA